jgi:membrane-associated phospholipid phosphatase
MSGANSNVLGFDNSQLVGNSASIGNLNHNLDINILDRQPYSGLSQQSTDRFVEYLNNTILPLAQTALREFEKSPDFATKMDLVLGDLSASQEFEKSLGIDRQMNVEFGDEGAIFAEVIRDVFEPGELAALKSEDDPGTLNINGQNIVVEQSSLDKGIFEVDGTGKLSIDFLADAGGYRSEMAVFSLTGMENLVSGSSDFMREAARRALSNSGSGYVVIADANEGARFAGELGESNKNEGKYSGVKTFNFTAGDRVAMMLVPDGTIQGVFANPSVDGSKRPLFSIAAANPNQAAQLGQLLLDTFGWEDLRIDRGGDADYNDIIFQVKGAVGVQPDFGILVAPGKDWRNLPLAKEIFAAVTQDKIPPDLSASLFKDTGKSNSDRVTADGTIMGKVTDANAIGKFQAKLNSGNYLDVLTKLNTDGSFTLDKTTLAQINGGQFVDGAYQISLQSEDKFGNATPEVKLDFMLDTSAPATLGFMLDSLFDSAPIGDARTTFAAVDLIGQTEANTTVTIKETGASLTADAQGKFRFTNVALTLGDNSFTINAIDLAGNTRSQIGSIKRVDKDNNDVILDWNANLLNAIYTDKTAPPVASRNMAIVQSAVFDAVNSFAKTYKNYHFTGTAPVGGSVEAAAASAAYNALLALYPKQKTFFDQAFTSSLAKITDGAAEDAGVVFGKTVADDLLSFRGNDGADKTVAYSPGNNPGDWQPTAPALAAALLPQWGNVTPFGITSGSQFRPAGEPALTSDKYTADFNQVKDLGSFNSTTRTAEQTQIAQFWADGGGTFTPPGHWNQIAQNVAATKGNSLLENARLFALLDISLADAGIAAWDAKYQYSFWRPITAIQKADTDGNPNTIADPNWKPLITTPPFPEYISGHSTFSGAAATVLTSLLGDNISFNLNSLGTPGIDRTFSSFNAAATEAGISRIYGGIHFNSANIDGQTTGKSIGNYVFQNLLSATNK